MKEFIFEIAHQKWRVLSAILILLLLNVLALVFVSQYQIPAISALQTKWNDLRRQSSRAGMLDASALYQQGTADLDKLKTRIPEKRQFARVLGDLLESAASSAVEVGGINYKPVPTKEDSLFSYQLSFSVNGTYAAVKSYLSDLQRNPELIVVENVTFSNSDFFVENVVMNLNITVYLREGA